MVSLPCFIFGILNSICFSVFENETDSASCRKKIAMVIVNNLIACYNTKIMLSIVSFSIKLFKKFLTYSTLSIKINGLTPTSSTFTGNTLVRNSFFVEIIIIRLYKFSKKQAVYLRRQKKYVTKNNSP